MAGCKFWCKLFLFLALAGCASEYQKAPDSATEEKDRAAADCRAQAGYGSGLVGALARSQFIDDCMRAKGYVPKK